MKTLIAIPKSKCNLNAYANFINNGRTDGIYFYVNEGNVSVCHPHKKLSENTQIEELKWFLEGKEYEITNQ